MIYSRAAEMALNIAQTERIFGRNFNLLFCSEDVFFFAWQYYLLRLEVLFQTARWFTDRDKWPQDPKLFLCGSQAS